MIGMTFAGKPSHHLQELEREGKNVHEAHFTMLVPYLLLAISSLLLGVFYPFFSGPLTNYIQGSFRRPASLPSAPTSESGLQSLMLIGISVGAALIGAGLGYLRYFNDEPRQLGRMGLLQRFLWNRWYLNAVYYKVFVDGAMRASQGLYRYVEKGFWDRLNSVVPRDVLDYSKASQELDSKVVDGAINDVASGGSRLSNLFRRLQSGVTQQYLIGFALGIFLLLVYMIFIIGAT
jgi:NADH-quinone oxidoreductase subunit L